MNKLILLISATLLLNACGSDDNESEVIASEPLQLSFTSKPTDEQVMTFLRKKGRSDIELSHNAGRNSTYELRKRWQRGFAYIANANIKEFPDATVKVGGLVQFQINGQNYDFDMVKPLTTQVLGLDIPKESVLLDLIQKNIKVALTNYRSLVFSEPKITLASAEKREVFWYSPKSFKVKFDIISSAKVGSNKVETTQCLRGLRFYRDEIKGPFNRIIGELTKCKVLESKQYSYSDYDKLPTLESILKEKQAQAELAKLVDINIPDFKDEEEALRWVYKFLLTADKATIKSLLMNMLREDHFIKGSQSQLNGNGIRTMNTVNFVLFDSEVTFKESHCKQIFIKDYSLGYLQFYDALKQTNSRIFISKSGGKRVKGKMVNQTYKIGTIELANPNRTRDIENLKSWPLDELCADTAKKVEVF
jgi:hypothetical protein